MPTTKPPSGNFSPGTKPLPRLEHYALESEITATGQARRQINRINNQILSTTQPYSRAAELREGWAFARQQEAAMKAELAGATPFPRPRVNNERGGPYRSEPSG